MRGEDRDGEERVTKGKEEGRDERKMGSWDKRRVGGGGEGGKMKRGEIKKWGVNKIRKGDKHKMNE